MASPMPEEAPVTMAMRVERSVVEDMESFLEWLEGVLRPVLRKGGRENEREGGGMKGREGGRRKENQRSVFFMGEGREGKCEI